MSIDHLKDARIAVAESLKLSAESFGLIRAGHGHSEHDSPVRARIAESRATLARIQARLERIALDAALEDGRAGICSHPARKP